MRTSERAVQQIRWDPRLSPARFVVLVDVHRPLPKKIPLPEFVPGGDIPWHRVLAIALDGERVWDRATGVDRLDEIAELGLARPRRLVGADWRLRDPVRWDGQGWSAGPGTDRPIGERLRVVCWNVLWDRFEAERIGSSERWPLLIDALLAEEADVLALQEVDPGFHALVLADPRVRDGWWASHPPGHADIGRYDVLLLGRGPVDQIGMWPLGPHKALLAAAVGEVVVATVHLTSDHAQKAASTRARQVEALGGLLAGLAGGVVLCGDFNLQDEAAPVDGLTDAWTAVHGAPAPTFDPPNNPLAAIGSLSGRPTRIDRVLLRGLHATSVRRLGTAPVGGIWLSDHYGLSAELGVQAPADVFAGEPSVRSALAWVPAAAEGLQAVRAVHDPAFGRWPAHVNVLWGFVGESDLDAAAPVLETAVRDLRPFPTRLDRRGTFVHEASATHGLTPADPEPWLALHAALKRAFPLCGRADFSPHLTFARTPVDLPAPAVDPVLGEVDALVVLTRRGPEPFVVRGRAPLGGPVTWDPEPPWPPGEPADTGFSCSPRAAPTATVGRSLAGPSRIELPGAVVVGSRALGTAIDGADLDLVWPDHGPEAVRLILEPHVDGLIPVIKAGLPGFRAWRGDLAIDAVPGPDPRAVSAIADSLAIRDAVGERLPAFVELTRTIKAWARAQALDDPAFGGIEGLALAVLCARTVRECGDQAPLSAFFARWAAQDWTRPVGLLADPPGEGFAILTPTAPVRNIAERLILPRFEAALLEGWAILDGGGARDDLWRPFPFHRRFRFALEVRVADRVAAGVARGRARALIERVEGVPCPGRSRRSADGAAEFVLGLPDGSDARLEAAQAWAAGLDGVCVARIDVERVPSPGPTS